MRIVPIACVLLSLMFAGCVSRGVIDQPVPAAIAEPVTLEVTNHNWADIVIYVVRGTQRVRMMTVVATTAATATIPDNMLGPGGEIRLHARPIGGRTRVTSERVWATPGSTVSWTLETDLRRSTVSVW